MPYMFFVVLVSFLTLKTVHSVTDEDVKNLHKELFITRSYNKLVRPLFDQDEIMEADIEFSVYGINEVIEVEQKFITTGHLKLRWHDEFLTWDPDDYGDLYFLYVTQDKIWKPEVSLENGFKNLEELGSNFIMPLINHDGTVIWTTFQVLESKCTFDSTYFPFDKHTCHLDFTVWSYDTEDLVLNARDEKVDLDYLTEKNGQWDIVSSSSYVHPNSYDIKARFYITIKRKPLYILINIILPIILLSVLNIFTFQIPVESGERVGYTITVWLSFAVFLTVVSGSLPKSSDSTPIVSIYIVTQLVIGTLTVLISLTQIRIASLNENKPTTKWIRRLVILFKRKQKVDPMVEIDKPETERLVTWKDGMAAVDALLFFIFLIVFIISTVVTLLVAAFSD